MRFLVFTTDVIPLPGLATSGTALRTWGIIEGLRSHGHEVTVSVPEPALTNVLKSVDTATLSADTQAALGELKKLAFTAANQSRVIAEVGPEVIVCGHWPALTLSTKPSQPLVIDLAGPHLLERHYQQSPNQIDAVRGKLSVLSRADYYIVSGSQQRLYFLSFLLRAGVKAAEKRIATITMPLDPAMPQRSLVDRGSAPDYPRFVFGGVFLPWQDPSTGLRTLADILSERQRGSLTLIGGPHPSYKIKEGVYEKLFADLSSHPQVETLPLRPYAEFIEKLCTCDVALDLMAWNLERELAVTIRSTTYLWSGVPVIYNNYADLRTVISRYDAGWCIDPADPAALRNVCAEIYGNPAIVQRKARNAQELARNEFSWDRAVRPLLELLNVSTNEPLAETDIILDFPENAELTLKPDQPIEQHFICRTDGLSRVECRLATHGKQVRSAITASVYELQASGHPASAGARKLIVRKEIAPETIANNQWHALDMPPVAGSAGRSFVFRLEANASSDPSVSPWALRGSPYPMNGLFCGTRKLDNHALCFRTTCVS